MGARILTAIRGTTIKLRIIFTDCVNTEMRDIMTVSMAQSSYNVQYLSLDGFMSKDFHVRAFGGYGLNVILPQVQSITLERSIMPYELLASLTTARELIIWLPPMSFLVSNIDPIHLPQLRSLTLYTDHLFPVLFSTLPDYANRFPINMARIHTLRISDSKNSKLTAGDILVFTATLTCRNVRRLILNVGAPFSIRDIRKLLKHMPAMKHIEGINVQKKVASKKFEETVCTDFPKLQTLKWSWRTPEQALILHSFLPGLEQHMEKKMNNKCGRICIPKNRSKQPYFTRNPHVHCE